MFTAERWAAAFVNALEDGAGDRLDKPGTRDAEYRGLAVLKALAGPIGLIPGKKSGSADAAQLDRMIQRAFTQCGLGLHPQGLHPMGYNPWGKEGEIARRFLLLTVKRDVFSHIHLIIREIEKLLDKKGKILTVTAESAVPVDDGFWEPFKEPLKRKTGAENVRFIVRTVPELLSGCRLLAGGESFDASLRGQLQKMAEDLALPPGGF